MAGKTIDQFMWRWQHSYAVSIHVAAKALFEQIGVGQEPKTFLVGIARPGQRVRHGACVEPEDGEWPQALFNQIPSTIEKRFRDHPAQEIFYTDAPTMADKPENIRRASVRDAVVDALAEYDRQHQVQSFVSVARPVDDYHVVIVVQVPLSTLAAYPTVPYRWRDEISEDNLLLTSIAVLLNEAERLLERPEPGRFSQDGMRSSSEMASAAAVRFFRTPFINNDLAYSDLFNAFNGLSRLMYEGARSQGRLALVEANDPCLEYVIRLTEPTMLRDARWARKLLEMSGEDMVIAGGYQEIHGLARLRGDVSETCFVDFLDQQHWEFRRGNDVLVRVAFGEPVLPQPPISAERFRDNFTRIFHQASDADSDHCRAMLTALLAMNHGSMLLIAEDAASEAARLTGQGTRIQPTRLSEEFLARASRIDGTILADPAGICHAIGVILDGTADAACTPARGARYNSAVRFVNGSSGMRRLAFVISEDRTLDILPLLRPRISRILLDANLVTLEAATIDNWFAPRNFIRENCFYLDADQCRRANQVIERLSEEAQKNGQLVLVYPPLEPNPALTDDHFEP